MSNTMEMKELIQALDFREKRISEQWIIGLRNSGLNDIEYYNNFLSKIDKELASVSEWFSNVASINEINPEKVNIQIKVMKEQCIHNVALGIGILTIDLNSKKAKQSTDQ